MEKTQNHKIDPDIYAKILSQALPYMQYYSGKIIVIKYGGHAMACPQLAEKFCCDVVQLKHSGMIPVIIHGGGPQIGSMLERLNIKTNFKNGIRHTDKHIIDVVEMVLCGSINKHIVSQIQKAGGNAIGLSGKDGNILTAKKLSGKIYDPESNIEKIFDMGYVGDPQYVNAPFLLNLIEKSNAIPVIAPIAISEKGETLNVNADIFAGAIAAELNAKRLLLLTDVQGILDHNKKLIPEISIEEAQNMISDKSASGGMIPKIETAIKAVNQGVEGVIIVDGTRPHILLLELFTPHGSGTRISKKRK